MTKRRPLVVIALAVGTGGAIAGAVAAGAFQGPNAGQVANSSPTTSTSTPPTSASTSTTPTPTSAPTSATTSGSTPTSTTTSTTTPTTPTASTPTATATAPAAPPPTPQPASIPGTASVTYSGVLSGQLLNPVASCQPYPAGSSEITVNGSLDGTPWVLFIQSYDGQSGVWQVLTGQAGGGTGLIGQGYRITETYPTTVSGVTLVTWSRGATFDVQLTSGPGQTPAGTVAVQGTVTCG